MCYHVLHDYILFIYTDTSANWHPGAPWVQDCCVWVGFNKGAMENSQVQYRYIYICIYDIWYMFSICISGFLILYKYNNWIVLFIHIFKLVNVSAAMLPCLLANNCDVAFRCAELQSQMIHVWYIYLPGKPLRIQICPDRIREKSSLFRDSWDGIFRPSI